MERTSIHTQIYRYEARGVRLKANYTELNCRASNPSGQSILIIVLFLTYWPRTRPTTLSRGGWSYRLGLLGFLEMAPEHASLSCVMQVVLTLVLEFARKKNVDDNSESESL